MSYYLLTTKYRYRLESEENNMFGISRSAPIFVVVVDSLKRTLAALRFFAMKDLVLN